jgi:tight adherence protein B
MQFMIFVLYFVAALLALEGIFTLLRKRADPARVRDRLGVLASRIAKVEVGDGESILRDKNGLPNLLKLELLLYRAGATLGVARFLVLTAIVGAGCFGTVLLLTQDPFRAVPALLGGLIPWVGVRRKAGKRMRAFQEQLPDALALITRSMRSGHSLVAGFQLVGEELGDPIATEFGVVAEEIRLGLEVRDALANLMHRIDNEELPYLTTAVLIQRQTGGNLAELLDRLGSLLRERIQFKGRVRALTAQGRGAATFLALWMPFIIGVVWVVAPGYLLPLLETDWGRTTLASAFGIDVLAYFLARRIADVEA